MKEETSGFIAETNLPRLFVIDAMSLLFRSFYAMSKANLTTPEGVPIGATYGFIKALMKILKEQNPTHLAVCWDLKEKTFRHKLYPDYKANRGETPPEIRPQIALTKDFLASAGVPCFELPGYEADDIAATLARFFQPLGEVFLVTGDKDYMQVVNERVRIFSLKKGDDYEILGPEHVVDYFGVPPEKVQDALALSGDPIDNIPGIHGIGGKMAAKLIAEFGSLENLYENLHRVKNVKVREALIPERQNVLLYRALTTMDSSVPLGSLSESLLRYTMQTFWEHPAVREKLLQFQMQSLLKGLEGQVAAEEKRESGQPHLVSEDRFLPDGYRLVQTRCELNKVFARIEDPKTQVFSFDTETTGLDPLEDRPIGLSLCFAPGEAYYIPAHRCYEANAQDHLFSQQRETVEFSADEVWSGLKGALQKTAARLVAHNLKFDLHQLLNVGVDLEHLSCRCSMVAAWLCHPTEPGFSLDALSLKVLGRQKIPTSELIGKETRRSSMLEVPLSQLSQYACEDADATLQIWQHYERLLGQNPELLHLYEHMEIPALFVLLHMEREGVSIDIPRLERLGGEMKEKLASLEEELFQIVGFPFKITSPKQLGDILFEHLKVHEGTGFTGKLPRTTQGYKTDAGVLEQFADHHAVFLVQQHKELSKLLSTYVLALPKLIKKSTQKVHTHFNQIGTATGRLSSSDPNVQNIPIKSVWGKKVRMAFSASQKDGVITAADYSQIELRVLAHLTQDKNMLEAFQNGHDIHRETAAKLLGKTPEQVSGEERGRAKAVNFGILYGMGPHRLAKQEKISLPEAKQFIHNYFQHFSGIKNYLDQKRLEARTVGFVKTHFGRVRKIPVAASAQSGEARLFENIAINSPIQGTAADIMKLGMIAVAKTLKEHNLATKIVIQVHDELVLDGPESEVFVVQRLVKEALEGAARFDVPLLVDVGHGKNWVEAKSP